MTIPKSSLSPAIIHSFLITCLLIFLTTLSGAAQTGILTGKVTEAESGNPLPSATVRLISNSSTAARQSGAITKSDGTYLIKGLTPGEYTVTITFLSYASYTNAQVTIAAGEITTIDAALDRQDLSFDDIIVSASRRPEKATSAPASVSVVDAREIEHRAALTPVDHVRSVTGLDVVQTGVNQSTVVARGFNNIFSGSLMVLTDNRMASVPSLRYNAYNFIPLVNDDIQQIEVIRGPGSALYGPNTANGVLHIITRSPFASEGTSVSLAGGERDVFQGMFRHAGTVGDRIGYKISGQYMRGNDWEYTDTAEANARAILLDNNPAINPDTLKIGKRDPHIKRFAGEARVDLIPTDDITVILSAGINMAVNNVDVTGVGAAQAQDWRYMYYQARVLYNDLFFQTFLNESNSGDTYLLRTGEPIIDRSTLFVTQLQHSSSIGESELLTYGADLLLTNPVTDGTINGANEEDDNITEFGLYLQSETKLIADLLDLVVAGRIDYHSRLDAPIFSPRAALVYTPWEQQTFRFTYNQAYNAPTSSEMFLDIVANQSQLFDVRASGVPESGFSFRYDNGAPQMRSFFADDPSAFISTDALDLIWETFKDTIKQNVPGAYGDLVDQIPAPPAGTVQTELRILNPNTGAFDAFDASKIAGRDLVEPTTNTTIELGYKGVIADQFILSIDLYRSDYKNFVGPLEVITPTVFLERETLQAYLEQVLLQGGSSPEDAATQSALFATLISGIPGNKGALGAPIGNVTPEQAADPTAIMLTYRNYGDITLYGYDIGLQAAIMDGLTLSGNVSYVDKNFLPNLDNIADLSLNAPKLKYSISAGYDNISLGLNADIRLRHVDGFPVRSGVYIGNVPGYSTIDINIGYTLPFVENLQFTLTAQNLLTFVEGSDESPFEQRHREFIGTPEIGRLVLGRLSYTFE